MIAENFVFLFENENKEEVGITKENDEMIKKCIQMDVCMCVNASDRDAFLLELSLRPIEFGSCF